MKLYITGSPNKITPRFGGAISPKALPFRYLVAADNFDKAREYCKAHNIPSYVTEIKDTQLDSLRRLYSSAFEKEVGNRQDYSLTLPMNNYVVYQNSKLCILDDNITKFIPEAKNWCDWFLHQAPTPQPGQGWSNTLLKEYDDKLNEFIKARNIKPDRLIPNNKEKER